VGSGEPVEQPHAPGEIAQRSVDTRKLLAHFLAGGEQPIAAAGELVALGGGRAHQASRRTDAVDAGVARDHPAALLLRQRGHC
jgi:hypothetical protein